MEDGDRIVDEENVNDLCIILKECYCYLFVECLFKDIKNGELFNVFEKDVLKYLLVFDNFINVMKNKIYLEVNFVFLIEVVNLVNKIYYNEFFLRMSFYLFIYLRKIECFYYIFFRVIRWVIFYGYS